MNKLLSKIFKILPPKLRSIFENVQNSEIGSRIASGVFWSFLGSVISRGSMLLAAILVARILGKEQYGELGMIRSTINMFVVFAGFGLGLTATKYVAEFRESDKVKTGKIIGLSAIFAGLSGGLIAVIILTLTPYLAKNTINAPHLILELRLGAVMLFFSALNGAQTGVLSGFEAFKAIARVNLISGVVAFPIQIGFTYLWGLTGSVVGYGISFLLLWILSYSAVRKESKKYNVHINFFNAWNEWEVLYKFSLPALLSGLLVSPVVWICNAMLVNYPDGFGQMAIFDAANQWRTLIIFIPTILSQIALPLLSSSLDTNNKYNNILRVNLKINVVISLLVTAIVSIFSVPIMKLYGGDFEEGWPVLILLALSAVLFSIGNILGKVLASKGKMWLGFIFNFIWAVLIIAVSYVLLKEGYGAVGLAIANFISYLLFTIIIYIYIFRKGSTLIKQSTHG